MITVPSSNIIGVEEKSLTWDDVGNCLFVVEHNHKIIVALECDGSIMYGEGYKPDKAAQVFWDSIQARHADRHTSLHYRTYHGTTKISIKDNRIYGRIMFIDEVIMYEGRTPAELQQAFENAVDQYIEQYNEESDDDHDHCGDCDMCEGD